VERYIIHFGSGLASVTKRYSSVVLDSFERANKIYIYYWGFWPAQSGACWLVGTTSRKATSTWTAHQPYIPLFQQANK